MLVLTSTYTAPLDEVDAHRDDHIAFLRGLADTGHVVAFGRCRPPTGAVVLAVGWTAAEARAALTHDPYVRAGVAEYEIREFTPAYVNRGAW